MLLSNPHDDDRAMRTEVGDGEEFELSEEAPQGYTIAINCYADGTHDVARLPLVPLTEEEAPDGLYGLRSLEEALQGVIALKEQAPAYESAERRDMLEEFGRG